MDQVNVFISEDKTKVILTLNGVPCFCRSSHITLLREKGLLYDDLINVSIEFYYTGKGKSINQFLNN